VTSTALTIIAKAVTNGSTPRNQILQVFLMRSRLFLNMRNSFILEGMCSASKLVDRYSLLFIIMYFSMQATLGFTCLDKIHNFPCTTEDESSN